mmetsp:Transcript_22195/g.35605  ORF Transcript_22195/g.35605 Transcript_22195/m.35605 type:complete len:252 (-) Transcript_22195:138-893(-)
MSFGMIVLLTVWMLQLSFALHDIAYPTPLRWWQTGFFTGNPEYSPVGPFTNYSMVFRQNDGLSYPSDFLMVETGSNAFQSSLIPGTYQQWTVFGTQMTYCGLLTQNHGASYEIARPQFWYQDQLSTELEVYFCADPRGGGCNTFWWKWQYFNDTKKFLSNATVGGVPHELTYFDFHPDVHSNDIPIQTVHRDICVYVLGTEMPYDYDWITNETLRGVTWKNLDSASRQSFKDNIADYQQHYQHRLDYGHHH